MSINPAGLAGRERVSRTLVSFQNYNYRMFWFGQLISQVGTWMQMVALAWLVLQLTNSPFALGSVTAVQFLPLLCVTLFAGVVVDRVPKHRLLLITQSLALVQALVLAVLTAAGHIQVWEIYVLSAALGLVTAFDNPARQAFVMELVGRDNVVNAVGLNSAQMNGARLVGPAVGGLIIAAWGVSVCFFLNAASFLAVLIGLALMRPAEFHNVVERTRSGGAQVFKELADGVRFVLGAPDLAAICIILTGIGCFGYNFNIVTPLLSEDVLHTGAGGMGLLLGAIGVGSLVAALMVASSGRSSRRGLLAASVGFGAFFLGVAFASWIGVAFVLLAITGFCGLMFVMSANTTLQLRSPDYLRGRVMALYTLLMMGTTPFGALFTGWVAGALGVRAGIAIEATICLVSALAGVAWVARSKRAARRASRAEGVLAAA